MGRRKKEDYPFLQMKGITVASLSVTALAVRKVASVVAVELWPFPKKATTATVPCETRKDTLKCFFFPVLSKT